MHISYPLHLTPNLKMFPLHCIPQMLHAKSLDPGLIISLFVQKVFLTVLPTDRQTDGRQHYWYHGRSQHSIGRQKVTS